jgi:hypothetical protein
VILRRGRFDELVERQLVLFEEDAQVLFAEASAADIAWKNAAADESEELYGDYQLVVDSIGEQLHGVREAYAATLDDATADEYRATFDRKATKRFGRYASYLAEGGE